MNFSNFNQIKQIDPYGDLTFIAAEDNSSVTLSAFLGTPTVSGLMYRTSIYKLWKPYEINTEISLNKVGDYVQFTNEADSLSDALNDGDAGRNCVKFIMTGKINSTGNVFSLYKKRKSSNGIKSGFYKLFSDCTSLIVGPNIIQHSGVKAANSFYQSMFSGCTSMETMRKG